MFDNLKRKAMALLLSLAMIVTYMPASMIAYAVDDEDQVQTEQQVEAEEVASEDAPSEEAPPEEVAPEEDVTEDVAPEEAASEDVAPAEEETPEETAEPADEETEAEAEEADDVKDEYSAGYLTWNKGKYDVTVSYDAKAEIPEGSKLVLTEFGEYDKEYKDAKEALVADEDGNSPFSQTTDEEQEELGMAAFDLTIYDKDGNVVEPKSEVNVNFEFKELPEGVDAEALAASMEIQHLNESSGDVVVEKIATVDSQEAKADDAVGEIAVNENNETAVVETSVDAFSTFTVTWRSSNGNRTVTVHYVDESGNELTIANPNNTHPNLDAGSSSPAFLIYDIDGYEYSYTYRNTNTNANRIAPLLTKNGYNRWQYMGANNTSTTELSNGDDIYVVYKKKADPTKGGTATIEQATESDWPQGDDKPQFSKSSTNNGNGTNNISLSISGGEKPYEKETKANVIVVFDRSGSMGGNNIWRLNTAKAAVKDMADTLLNGKTKGVKMALVAFSTTASTVTAFTDDYEEYEDAVDGLSASGGTNWEQALSVANRMAVDSDAATYIVFVTDGDPTFRMSRGNVTNGNLDVFNSNTTYQYYRNNYVFGAGNSDNYGRNFDYAADEVASILANNKNFYAIGVSSDVTKVQNLVDEAGGGTAYLATDSDALEEAFAAITQSIKTTLGFGDVEITDGITALTNAEMKVMQTVDPNSFKYYRVVDGVKTEWTTREADGCAAATYNEADGAVHWDMGETFQLEDGVTYVVEFTVWPSQDAYDLVADLNNGLKTYDSLTKAEKAQVVEVTAPTETTTGTYALKTNTDKVNATYNRTSKTGESVSISDTADVDATYHEGKIQNMSLDSDYVTVKKDWNNTIPDDGRVATSVDLTVTKDGITYITPVTLNEDNGWESGKEYISAGLITKAANGKYNVREKGHDYTVTEPSDYSYYWDLKADVYRPMVIDGTLHVLIKTDNPTGTEGTNYFVIDGNKYQVQDGDITLNATNDRRSNLNLSKTVSGNNPNPNATFTYEITINLVNETEVWFSAQDKDGKTVEIPAYSANVTPEEKDGKLTGYYSVPSGQQFTISIKDGWNVRFINMPTGSTYSINETSMTAGYAFNNATASASNDGTAGTASGSTVTGTIDKPNNVFTAAYTNRVSGAVDELEVTKELSGRPWADSDEFKFELKAGDSENAAGESIDTPMPEGSTDGKKTVTVTKDSTDKTESFGKILFPYEGTYNYTIKEVKPENPIAGVVYDEKEYPVVVTVTKSGNNMVASVKYDDEDDLTVTNTLNPVKVKPEVTKVLNGRAFKDSDSFAFTIARAAGEPNDTPMPSSTTATATKASDWKAVFGEMSFNAVGTYKYTITETKGSLDGVTYNTTPVNVEVNVTTDENNALTYTIMYDGKDVDTASVENTFAPVEQALEVTKILTGRDWEAGDTFTFTLAAGESKNTAGTVIETPMPTQTTATARMDDPATTDVNETIAKFGKISFSEAGTYKYTITEQGGDLDGVTYNTTPKEVTVEVAKNAETNALSIQSVEYAGGANIENTFEPSGEVPLQITKTLNGREWETDDSFEFTISKAEGSPADTPMPTNTTATAKKANPVAAFGTVKFKKAGTYTYNVVETKGSADGITYDSITHTIVVTVTKGTDNKLSTAVVYDGNKENNGLTSVNTFAPTNAQIEATKKFNNWGKASSFTFKLAAVTAGAPMPAGTAADGTKSATATQTTAAQFGSIEFTKAGDYKYNVTEVNDGVDGVVYDTSAHEVTVHVVKDETTNALSATVDYGTAGKLEIENTFSAAKASIEATKDFGDFDWAKAGDGFTFELKALEGAPMPASTTGDTKTGTATESVKTVNFGEIAYESAGTYKYTVTEQNGGKDGVKYDTNAHNVIVVVSKAEDNTLSTAVYYDAKEAADGTVTGETSLTIENSFTPTTADIDVTKNFTGRKDNAWNDDDEFEFTLAPVDNAPMPAAKKGIVARLAGLLGAEADNTATVKVTKNSKDFTETFGTITYEKAGTYEYIITETNDKKDGITYDVAQHKVVVTVSKNPETNALTAEVKYDGNDKLTVNNTYESTKAELSATKSFNDWGKADSFEFTLSAKNNAPMPADAENGKVVRTVTRDEVTAIFGEIEYLTAGDYEYVIKETKGDADGVTYDTADHKVVVTVTKTSDEKSGKNELSASVKYDDKDTNLTITNTFESSDGVTLQATKEFADWGKADTFTFNLKADGSAPMPVDKDGKEVKTLTVTKDAPTAVFGSVSFDAVGVYTYHITEVNDGKDGVSYDITDHTIVVTVTKDEDNKLTATPAYDTNKDSVVIKNTYAPTKATLQATKEFNDWGKASSFTFNLAAGKATYTDGSAEGISPMPGTATTESATATQTQAAIFGEITYEKAGTYEYTITEVNDGVPGVSYDTKAHKVVVTVTKADDATNALTATVKYDEGTALKIENTYSSTTSDEIKVTKEINDWGKADKFTFNIAAVTKDAPMPAKTTAEATKDNKVANFGAITYETVGEYTYTITEVNGGADGVSYDTKPHEVVVTVSKADDATNALTATVTYDGKPNLTITNTFTPVTTDDEIEVTKEFADWGKADSFTFDLAAVTKDAPMPAKTEATATKNDPETEENESIAKFGKITFEKEGTYEYTITERNDGVDGVSYDTTPHKVVVEVKKADDATNKLSATVKYEDKDSLTVTNTFEPAKTPAPIQTTKAFSDWGQADSFTFNLTGVADEEGVMPPMPAKTEATATEKSPVAVFGDITFDKAGEYKYTITEVDDGVDGVTYDTTPKNVVVTVTKADDATNKLTAAVKYNDGNALTVTNTFESGKAVLQATKAFEDWGKADSFTFDLAAVSKDAPMPATTFATATKTTPVAVFEQIEYTKAGTYEYTITERNDGKDGVKYDVTPHKVVVTVTKGEGNALSTAVKYDDKDSLTVTNTYKPAVTDKSIQATKSFNDWGKADSFTFTLAAQDNAPMPEGATGSSKTAIATKEAPIADFGKISYEKAGTYKYTITEKNDGKDGVSYDVTPHEVVVTVTKADDATNKLTASVKYDGEDSLIVTNTYTSVTTEEPIAVTKDFNDWGKADSFTFDIAAVTKDAPMPAKTSATATKDAKTAEFGNITFEKAGTYEYTITERNGKADGVSYDTTPHNLVIVVKKAEDATNALTIDSVLYDGEESLTVSNTYKSLPMPTDKQLRVTKEISGRDWLDNDKFEFVLAAEDGVPMPKNTKATATKAEPTAIFDAMTFEKTGTYEYTITETDSKKGGLTYDTKSYKAVVVIGKADDATNALYVESVKYENAEGKVEEDSLTVVNDYEAEGTAAFDAKKILKGRNLNAEEFQFELKKDGTTVGTAVSNAADGSVTFNNVNFIKNKNKNDEGDYTFTISEVVPEEKLGGVEYSTDVATIAVKVTDDGEGTLDVTYDGKDKAPTPEFINYYEAKGDIELEGLKTLEYGDLADQEFDFVVLDEEGNEVATAKSGDAVTGDADSKAGTSSKLTFSKIEYVKKYDKEADKAIDETGEHVYTVKEVIPDEAVNTKTGKTYAKSSDKEKTEGIFELGNYRYDAAVKTVKVNVKDDGQGKLITKVTDDSEAAEFVNTKAYTDIKVTKKLENFVEHDGVNEVTIAFRVVDKETKGSKFSAAGGMTFTKAEVESGNVKTLTISKIPTEFPVEITEVYASNFKADPKTVTLSLKDGVYEASFKNVYDNTNYNSGVINNYKKNESGAYDYVSPGDQSGN